jgi:hypothetical protein
LVTGIVQFDDGGIGVSVAYGTSKKLNDLHSGEFTITRDDGDAYVHSGLSFSTKFNLARRANLPYTDEWFRVPPAPRFGQNPKLGLLHPSLVRRAQAAFEAISRPAPG